MKILLSAFACEPGLGSEEGIGWGTAWSLARDHEVHVLTRPRHRAAIERELARHPRRKLAFSYFDFSPTLLRCVVTSSLWQIYYHAWQCRIASWARATASAFDPDIVHHVTYGRYWTPCSLWRLGRPFVWGPLGGGDACPPAFQACLGFRERMVEKLRDVMQRLASFDPDLRATARHTAVAIAATPETERRLRALGCRTVVQVPQNALGPDDLVREVRPAEKPPLFCSVGRMVGWKGNVLTVRAFARARIPGARLVIIGDGRTRRELAALVRSLGLSARVCLPGAMSRDAARAWIARSTALVHPSLHDPSPSVVLEAMAAGKPVVGLALAGLPAQVTAETGILVPAHSPEETINALAAALERLAASPALCSRLGAAGHARAREEFTWEKRALQFGASYRLALGKIEKRAAPAAELLRAAGSPESVAM